MMTSQEVSANPSLIEMLMSRTSVRLKIYEFLIEVDKTFKNTDLKEIASTLREILAFVNIGNS